MPYIANTDKDIREMLEVIGVKSIKDLYAHLPQEVILNTDLDLPSGLSEQETRLAVLSLAAKNSSIARCNSFLGAGCYDHYVPAALKYLIERCEFLTAYTPYQAECSQGSLQAIYEYQSYMCLLTGMDVSNASLFDGASGMAEAVLMGLRMTRRNKIVVASSVHPEYRKVLQTYLSGHDYTIQEIGFDRRGVLDTAAFKAALDEHVACVVLQSPNFFGLIEDAREFVAHAHAKGAITILVTNPASLSILKEPAALGVDIVCGDGQPLGGAMSFGGPSFGFIATRTQHLRQMPGRIVGKTVDTEGRPAYCLTLQAREQHIRRQAATSNICSNQSLNAIAAAMYLALMGRSGFAQAGRISLNLAHYLYSRLQSVKGVELPFANCFFNEFVWRVNDAKTVISELYKKNIIAGVALGERYPQLADCIVSCCTEKKTKEQIDAFVNALQEVLEKKA